jgi:preprotein translocase subunit YajC
MSNALGIIIESLVAFLLILTIAYCMLLNSRLKRLKADEQSLKATIAELITATEIAERAIGGLKVTVRDCNENLGNRLESAADSIAALDKRLVAGDELLRRLSRIVSAGRGSNAADEDAAPAATAPAPAQPKSILAAAQAFSERRRSGSGLAA